MNVLVFEAWRHVRDAVRYCKRNREPLAEFTFRGRVYVIQRLKIGWIRVDGSERPIARRRFSESVLVAFSACQQP